MGYELWYIAFGQIPLRGPAGADFVFFSQKLAILGQFSNGSRQANFDTRDLIFGGYTLAYKVFEMVHLNF